MFTANDHLFYDLFKASPVAIAIKNLEGRPLFVNPALCSMLGFSEAELRRMHCVDFSPAEDAEKDWALFQQLRAGSIDHYQLEKRYFQQNGSLIWGRQSTSLLNGRHPPLVLAIVEDISDKKAAEGGRPRHAAMKEKLREYEQAVEGSEEMICVVDREYRYLAANRKFLRMWHKSRKEVVGRFAYEELNEGVFEAVVKSKLDECFQGNIVRYELKYAFPELGERDLSISYFPIEGSNRVDRVVCNLRDITDRKRAAENLADMSRKLIAAQEQERARIGRELHDDINQRLALLSLELEQLQKHPFEAKRRISGMRNRIYELSNDLQAISHDLHSSKLEYLGVIAGMENWCREFAVRQTMKIDFKSNVSSAIPLEAGLSLFRVLQEALSNASKHSGVREVEVELRGSAHEIHFAIRDLGKGFDINAALHSGGLGLTSMRERARLLNGTITIDSKPNRGTTIRVRVPIESKYISQRPAV